MQYRNAAIGMAVGALLAVLAGGAKPARAAFTVGRNFTGTSESDGNAAIPPDTMGAAGPSDFAELLNTRFTVYNKSTGSLVDGLSQWDFWRAGGVTIDPNGGPSDPRIVFDKSSGHWFASAVDELGTANSRYLVGVSNTSDPTQGWHAFSFKADPNDQYWADFDMLGYNKDGVYIGANLFGVDPNANLPEQLALVALNKANLIAGAPTGTLFDNIDPVGTGFTPHPVDNLDNGPSPEVTVGDGLVLGSDRILKLAEIVGPDEGNTLDVSGGIVPIASYDVAGPAHQPGGDNTLDTLDARLGSSLVEVGGKIWGVHTIANGAHSALRWFRLDAATGSLEEEGTIGDSTNDYYDGSIAINPSGFVVIGYTRSSDTEFASAYASTGFYDGTSTSFDNPTLLKAGVAAYDEADNNNTNRWGDYSATTVDPANPHIFWTVQEYAAGPTNWSTQVTELIDPTPEPASGVVLALGMLPLLLIRRRSGRGAARFREASD